MDLKTFFEETPRFAVAFSGGVDSSYLLYAAKTHGCDVKAYMIQTQLQPQFEVDDAMKMAYMLNIPLTTDTVDVFANTDVTSNPADRCYHCKSAVFRRIRELAAGDGYDVVCDGTNASDDVSERAGFRALEELDILSPLRDAGMTKKQVRRLSREAGLFTHDKPSYACLATRIPTGIEITQTLLDKVSEAEIALKTLGFSNFRVRLIGNAAKIQIPDAQFRMFSEKRRKIYDVLHPYFSDVLLDLKPRKTED